MVSLAQTSVIPEHKVRSKPRELPIIFYKLTNKWKIKYIYICVYVFLNILHLLEQDK